MKIEEKAIVNESSENYSDAPPFSFYLILPIIISFFFLVLDLSWRGSAVIQYFSFMQFLKNASVLIVFFFLLTMITASTCFLMERIIAGTVKKIQGNISDKKFVYVQGSLYLFLFYLVFIYVNLMYLKFYLYTFAVKTYKDAKALAVLFALLFVFSAVLFVVRLKPRLRYGSFKTFSRYVSYVWLGMGILCLLFSSIIYIAGLHGEKQVSGKKGNDKNKKPDVVILTFDSLSARNMSLYGYSRKTTPNMDEFGSENYVFNRMIANSDNTQYAVRPILGEYPPIDISGYDKDTPLLSTLEKNGYKERIFISFKVFDYAIRKQMTGIIKIERFKNNRIYKILAKGRNAGNVEWLSSILSEQPHFWNLFSDKHPRDFFYYDYNASPIGLYFDYICDYLFRNRDYPVFIWAHFYEPHHPFSLPPEYRKLFGNKTLDMYDASIYRADNYFGEFIETLRKNNKLDDIILIVSSDHGLTMTEENGELKFSIRQDVVNQYKLHIPLIIKAPGYKGGVRVESFVSQVDLTPTILEMLGIPPDLELDGESMVKYMKNPRKISDTMKVSIPSSYLDWKLNTPQASLFKTIGENMFSAFSGKFRVIWIQSVRKGEPPFQFYGIYNWFEDPGENENLMKKPEYKYLLDKVFYNPLVQRLR